MDNELKTIDTQLLLEYIVFLSGDIQLNPISDTAFYCCGVRMLDAAHPHSLCHDHYAKRFMDTHGMHIFAPFKSQTMPNISNTLRCYIIDTAVQSHLNNYPDGLVISIGAGFDTRPYRLTGGHWVEIDEPQIMLFKNEKLAITECKNKLIRFSMDFANETLSDKLSRFKTTKTVLIVIEGVFMYLEESAIADTLKQLQTLFPQHVLLCDLMTKKFFDSFAKPVHDKLVAVGAQFATRRDDPTAIFKQNHYIETACISMFERASALGVLWDRAKIPALIAKFLSNTIMKNIHGYAVHRFEFNQPE